MSHVIVFACAGLTVDDIDVFEINEAFASQVTDRFSWISPRFFFQYFPVIHNSDFHNIPRLCIVWKNWAFLWRKWILMEEPLLLVIHWAALVLDRSWLCSMSSNADARGDIYYHMIISYRRVQWKLLFPPNFEFHLNFFWNSKLDFMIPLFLPHCWNYTNLIPYCKPNYTGFKFRNKKDYDPFSDWQCCVLCCRGYGVVSMCIGTGMGAAAVFEFPGQCWKSCHKIPRWWHTEKLTVTNSF